MAKKKVRSAKSGLYVSPEEAKRNPSTTITEREPVVTAAWLDSLQERLVGVIKDVRLVQRKLRRRKR